MGIAALNDADEFGSSVMWSHAGVVRTPAMPNASGIAGVRFFESADLPLIS
jgi:hypothetical protein